MDWLDPAPSDMSNLDSCRFCLLENSDKIQIDLQIKKMFRILFDNEVSFIVPEISLNLQ